MSTPSQIRWSSFMNQNPSSIQDLWPPLRFNNSGKTSVGYDEDDMEMEPLLSDDHSFTMPMGHQASPNIGKQVNASLPSLGAFIEREVGLNTIRTNNTSTRSRDSQTKQSSCKSLAAESPVYAMEEYDCLLGITPGRESFWTDNPADEKELVPIASSELLPSPQVSDKTTGSEKYQPSADRSCNKFRRFVKKCSQAKKHRKQAMQSMRRKLRGIRDHVATYLCRKKHGQLSAFSGT